MKVIDVSEHQDKINWAKVASDGVEGVIIRAGFGRANEDPWFKANIKGAIANGLRIGIYWFSYAYTASMAKNEAGYCHEVIKEYKDSISLPVFFDWEYDSMRFAKTKGAAPTRQNITDWNRIFCEEIKELGYIPGFYCNLDYSKNYIDCEKLKEYKLWWAQYTKKQQKNNYLWQYSSAGKVNGINGDVDMNELWKLEEAPEKPVEHRKTNEEIAEEVLEDKWGTENTTPTREERLEAAGYDYDAIQKIVNKLWAERNKPTVKCGYTIGKTYTVVATKGLNIRTGAGMGYTKIGKYNYGDKIIVKDAKKVGSEVWVKTGAGWACAVGRGKYIA